MSAPHDVPTAAQLVEAVREWLERDVLTGTQGRLQFHTRVAVNVLAMVERELAVGAGQAEQHRAMLERYGVADDAELAEAIRDGRLDWRDPDLRAAVRESVAAKLAVANPKY